MDRANAVLVMEEPRGPSQLIEIIVNRSGQSRIQFPEVQNLKSLTTQTIIIKGMRLVTADVLTNGVISGNVNAPETELQKISLVIYCEGWEKAQFLPIQFLNDTTFAGSTFPHRYAGTKFNDWQNVDWSKTYLLYSNGTSSIAETPYCVMLDVEYIKLNGQNQEIIGPS